MRKHSEDHNFFVVSYQSGTAESNIHWVPCTRVKEMQKQLCIEEDLFWHVAKKSVLVDDSSSQPNWSQAQPCVVLKVQYNKRVSKSPLSSKHVFYRNYLRFICVMINLMLKPLILCHSEQVLSRPVDLMRRFQLEQFRALLRVEENPEGKHQVLAVNGERHPTCGSELNPGHSGERRTCYHGATKMFILIEFIDVLLSYDMKYYICLTSLTRAKCGTRSTLCWKVGNISGSTELFAL